LLLLLLQHTLDYLGIPSPPRLPIRFPLSQPYLFVHSYSCESVEEAGRDCGLLLYSTQGGWAALDGEGGSECGDPRPANMDPQVGRGVNFTAAGNVKFTAAGSFRFEVDVKFSSK
jgi:hypothetical protein